MNYAYLMPLLEAFQYNVEVDVQHFSGDGMFPETYRGQAIEVKRKMIGDYDKGILVDDPYDMIVWYGAIENGRLYIEC